VCGGETGDKVEGRLGTRWRGDWGQGRGETGDKVEGRQVQGGGKTGDKTENNLNTGDSESSTISHYTAVVFGVVLLIECSHFMDIPSLSPVSPQQLGEGRGELCKGGEEGREVGRRA